MLNFYGSFFYINNVYRLPATRRISGNDFVPAGQCTDTPRRARATVERCVKKPQAFLRPTCGLQTAQISVLWITRSGLSRGIVFTRDKFIVWMNWNAGSSMSGAVLNSQVLTRLLTSGDRERHQACVHAKGGHFEYSLWTDNVDLVHICYIQCDLFDCYIFNYDTFLFMLQGTALAD